MKNFFLTLTLISGLLFVFSFSRADKVNTIKSKASSAQFCAGIGSGRSNGEAATAAWNNLRTKPCYNPNLPLYYRYNGARAGQRVKCVASHQPLPNFNF